jgi:iron(III) transport system substrate-binding protein
MGFRKSILVGLFFLFGIFFSHADDLVVYSGRGERLIKPVLDKFTEKTGIKVILHSAGTVELLNKILMEGERTPADVFVTVDAGTLERARTVGLLQPLQSDSITQNVPAEMRAPDNSWMGFSMRIRVIAYNPEKVNPNEIKTFDDLALPQFKGRLGLRTGSNVYAQSHMAMLIAEQGEEKTETLLKKLVENAGDKIYPSDSLAVEAVAKREVDAAIVNHYYVYGYLLKNPQDAKTLAFIAPEKTAYNISGAGILKTSIHKKEAQQLLEFMASDEGQKIFAEENYEYPVNPKIPAHSSLLKRDSIKLSPVSLSKMGRYVVTAVDMIDRVGYR